MHVMHVLTVLYTLIILSQFLCHKSLVNRHWYHWVNFQQGLHRTVISDI